MATDSSPDPAPEADTADASGQPPASNRDPTIPPAFREYETETLPNATPRGHGKDGVLTATLGRSGDGPTRLLRDRAEVPLHLTGTLDHDPLGPTLCIQEPTGGVAQGDRHRIAIEANRGTRAIVTTQSATKVHTMHSDYAHLDVALDVGPDAHIEYVPDPTIINERARCLQTTRVDLAAGASAIVADILVPDGLSDHAPFSFDHYQSRLDAHHEGQLVCGDAVDLRPATHDPRTLATVGDRKTIGTLYVLAPDATAGDATDGIEAATLADRIHDHLAGIEQSDTAIDASASVLPFEAGVGVRVLGDRTAAVETAIETAREDARRALFDVGVPADRSY